MIEDKEARMEELIEMAKQQAKDWYIPDTNREWIETQIWSYPPEGGELTKIFILKGGEAKGTVLANYRFGTVIAYDMDFKKTRTYRVHNNEERCDKW